jgi:peroxiredoxin
MSFSAALSYSKRLTAAAPVLALVIGGYWYTSTQLIVDKLNGGKARIRPSDVLGKELVDLQTGRPVRIQSDSRPMVVVLLSGTECPACLDESAVWDRLASSQKKAIRVVGVFVGTTSKDVENYLKERRPAYEVYRFAHHQDEGTLGADYTRPLTVLMDRWGRIRYASGPTGNVAEHQRMARDIHKLTGV